MKNKYSNLPESIIVVIFRCMNSVASILRPMKRRSLVMLLLFVLFTLSCKQDTVEVRNSKNGFEPISDLHNRGLDYILGKLKELSASNQKLDQKALLEFNKKAGLEFVLKELPQLNSAQVDSVTRFIKSYDEANLINEFFKSTESGSNPNGRTTDLISDFLGRVTVGLTSMQNAYISRIVAAVETYDYDINYLQSRLNTIGTQINANVPTSQQPVLYLALDVARKSSNYWNANAATYADQINYITNGGTYSFTGGYRIQRIQSIHWGLVAAADVVAAVAVGTATSTALVVPFVGWAFWGAVTAGGALITSGATAIFSAYIFS